MQLGVRNRFNAYFGEGNRIDVIANHTFVSIDSVSLSALGQENSQQVEDLWRPTKDFLGNVKKQKKRLIQRELRIQQGMRPYPRYLHNAIPEKDLATAELPHATDDVTDLPTILLTHVPLHRNPGTPCGPMREHWPPSPQSAGQPLHHDDRNAIAVRGGYQYQNVLDRGITADIAEKVGDIRYAFSGDDHDYCEVLHRGYASAGGGIKEITVKSISWAMGIRLPGVVMMSMWNPVDEQGNPQSGDASKTVQTHLCLLPDQIGTFLKYGLLFSVTLALLVARAALVTLGIIALPPSAAEAPLLPTTSANTSSAESEKALLSHQQHSEPHVEDHHSHSANSSTSSERGNLQVRSTQARTRGLSPNTAAAGAAMAASRSSPSPGQQKYAYPLVQHAGYFGNDENEGVYSSSNGIDFSGSNGNGYGNGKVKVYGRASKPRKKLKGAALFFHELKSSLFSVLLGGFVWYSWLVWRG